MVGILETEFVMADWEESNMYVGYSESKYRLRIFLAHPQDCPFAHV